MEGSTVFSFLRVMTTMHGALNLCSALAKSSEHLPRYCFLSFTFSGLDDLGALDSTDSVEDFSGGHTRDSMVLLMMGS